MIIDRENFQCRLVMPTCYVYLLLISRYQRHVSGSPSSAGVAEKHFNIQNVDE